MTQDNGGFGGHDPFEDPDRIEPMREPDPGKEGRRGYLMVGAGVTAAALVVGGF